MRLIQLHWKANPNIAEFPIFVDPDKVASVYGVDGERTMIIIQSAPPIMVGMPPAVVVEQLYDGYGATKH